MDRQQLLKKLSASKLVLDIPEQGVQDLIDRKIGHLTEFKKGETIINQGSCWNALSALLEGRVNVTRIFENGDEVLIKVLKGGQIVGGEVVRNPGMKSRFCYKAETPVTAYSIDSAVFSDQSFFETETGVQILKNLVSILEHASTEQYRHLDILSSPSIKGKLLAFLKYESGRQRSNEFNLPFTKEKLARYLCVNRSALSREMSKLEDEGYFKYKGKHFIMLK